MINDLTCKQSPILTISVYWRVNWSMFKIFIFSLPSYSESVTLCIQYWFSCPIIYIVIRGGGEREEGWSRGRSLNKWYHHIIKCNIWYKFAVKSHCLFMKIKNPRMFVVKRDQGAANIIFLCWARCLLFQVVTVNLL